MIHSELCKSLKFHHTDKWYMHKPGSVRDNKMHKILWDFEIQTDHPISARRPDLILMNKKKRTCHLVYFAILADHWTKVKKSKKLDKCWNFAWELKKLGNMKVKVKVTVKVKVISIVVSVFGTVPKSPEKRPFRLLSKNTWSWRPEETCCHLHFSEKPPVKTGVKNSQGE